MKFIKSSIFFIHISQLYSPGLQEKQRSFIGINLFGYTPRMIKEESKKIRKSVSVCVCVIKFIKAYIYNSTQICGLCKNPHANMMCKFSKECLKFFHISCGYQNGAKFEFSSNGKWVICWRHKDEK